MTQSPSPHDFLLKWRGDVLTVTLKLDAPRKGRAAFRTNIGHARVRRREIIAETRTDTVVLARYMQILSESFTEEFKYRIINIHHGFLPAFKGAKPYHQAWHKGVKIIGATAHFATEDLDQGPIICQDIQRVPETASIDELVELGKDIEKRTLSAALKLWLEHRVFVYAGRTFIL